MKVVVRVPEREDYEIKGPMRVLDIVQRLDFLAEEVIVIRKDELLTRNDVVEDSDEIEVRPAVSGG